MTVTLDVPYVILVIAALLMIAGFAIAWVLALLGSTDEPDPDEDDARPRSRVDLAARTRR